jgi:hypothetical protein
MLIRLKGSTAAPLRKPRDALTEYYIFDAEDGGFCEGLAGEAARNAPKRRKGRDENEAYNRCDRSAPSEYVYTRNGDESERPCGPRSTSKEDDDTCQSTSKDIDMYRSAEKQLAYIWGKRCECAASDQPECQIPYDRRACTRMQCCIIRGRSEPRLKRIRDRLQHEQDHPHKALDSRERGHQGRGGDRD